MIGIIATLIALLLPALSAARFAAGQIKCLSNVRQLSQVMNMYAADNHGYLPRFSITWYNTAAATIPAPKWKYNWTGLIFPYTSNNTSVFECPLRQFTSNNVGQMSSSIVGNAVYQARLSYQVNGITGGGNANKFRAYDHPFGEVYDVYVSANGGYNDSENTMQISNVSPRCIMLLDGWLDETSIRIFGNDKADSNTNAFGWGQVTGIPVSSHNGKSVSIAFFDGHCETVQTSYLLSDVNYGHSGVQANGDLNIPYNNTGFGSKGFGGYWGLSLSLSIPSES